MYFLCGLILQKVEIVMWQTSVHLKCFGTEYLCGWTHLPDAAGLHSKWFTSGAIVLWLLFNLRSVMLNWHTFNINTPFTQEHGGNGASCPEDELGVPDRLNEHDSQGSSRGL